MLGRLALSVGRKRAPSALAAAAGSWPSPAASSLFFQSSAAMTAAAAAAATPSATSTSTSATNALARSCSSSYLFFSSSARASGGNSSSDEDEGQRTARPKASSLLAAATSSRPESLEWSGGSSPSPAPGTEASPLRRALLKLGGFYSTESRLIRGARRSYDAVVAQATDGDFVDALGLRRDNFADTHALLCLHVWLLLVRLRAEGANGAQAAQLLYDFFSDDAEVRVRAAGVRVRVSKWLAELEKMFYGAATAYDKALGSPGGGGGGGGGKEGGAGEDASSFVARPFAPPADARRALSDALLRNVFGDDAGRRAKANLLSDYVIREIACLAQTGSDAVLDGRLRFSGGGGGDVKSSSSAAAATAAAASAGGAETAAA